MFFSDLKCLRDFFTFYDKYAENCYFFLFPFAKCITSLKTLPQIAKFSKLFPSFPKEIKTNIHPWLLFQPSFLFVHLSVLSCITFQWCKVWALKKGLTQKLLTWKNLRFSTYHHDTWSKWLAHDYVILIEFKLDRMKIVHFSVMAYLVNPSFYCSLGSTRATHTTAWDQHWGGFETLTMWF